ncbi:uncharacterized protein LOC143745597 isoform X1 [Siphateles boraxobius]|uniref:uncharacterized protein LOC143745597 isoform X1 n=1 Tax=Siphateles boraxobius TaxID=180520 RepID=UPI004062D473
MFNIEEVLCPQGKPATQCHTEGLHERHLAVAPQTHFLLDTSGWTPVDGQQTSFPYRHSLFKLTSFPYRHSLFKVDAPCRCQRQITLVCVKGRSYHQNRNAQSAAAGITLEMIGRGFVSSNNQNPFKVLPSYHFWAPWIGHKTRSSNEVLNTEFEKIKTAKVSEESQVYHVTEDRLMEELMNQKVDVVRKLCKECGLDTVGSKLDLISRLRSEMQTRHSYDKIFQKIWGASGGWCAIMCPCGVVYSLKFLIRAESPRDYAGLLLSWKHLPNKCIYDFARGLVAHTNVTRAPDIVPFQPFEGRLLEPTTENISMAREGKIFSHLSWLREKKETPDENGHPITGSADHLVLYDTFHESNTKDPRDILRKISLVPELAGKINSQVVEQFFSQMRKNNYFLNNAAPETNIFLLRSIVHHHNQRTNNEFIKRARKTFVTDTEFNDYGQAVLCTATEPENQCGEHCQELILPVNLKPSRSCWTLGHHSLQEQLCFLSKLSDKLCPGSE